MTDEQWEAARRTMEIWRRDAERGDRERAKAEAEGRCLICGGPVFRETGLCPHCHKGYQP